jgi:hypothetical protein
LTRAPTLRRRFEVLAAVLADRFRSNARGLWLGRAAIIQAVLGRLCRRSWGIFPKNIFNPAAAGAGSEQRSESKYDKNPHHDQG